MRSTLRIALLAACTATAMTVAAQSAATDTVRLTLDDAIARARTHSVNAAVALDELRSAYWQYRTYRAELLPEVNLTATVPSYHKQYSSYMNADGTYSFVRNNFLQMNGGLSITQNVWLTGAQLSVNTSLDWLRELEGDPYNRFMTIPVALTLSQPIFGVNTVKWDRRIEPVRYAEAKAAFLTATETVAMSAINYYFNLLMAKENLEIARQNHANAAKLYEVAREKRQMGQISENDLLQMELNLLNARSDMTDCESELKSNMFTLRSFLDLEPTVEIEPEIPTGIPVVEVTYADALEKALANNKFVRNLRRRQLEADYEVAKAKGNLRQISLFAQIGYTGTDHRVSDAYRRLKDNQVVEIGLSIPLIDWGVRKGRLNMAKNNLNILEIQARQDELSMEEDVIMTVSDFNIQRQLVSSAIEALDLAETSYAQTRQRFIIGKADLNTLTLSQNRQQDANKNYITSLQNYWLSYYKLRKLTLFDFDSGMELSNKFDIQHHIR